ncbi:hypothetical protein [Sphingobium sp. B12D2B]|uniref:hypothetical protein n=1 Tax=Sphingobium sp. B12D2B TaxID=2940577 RepID=UPI0022254876|nr:hypothetical protein [Sphingobium sp. B12D2B]MCW2349915.1 hypothetical protein [Sphingobium sp. B12D2B]
MNGKIATLLCGLLALAPMAAQARSSQWWFVAQGADRVLFVDVGSIKREGDIVRYQASQVIRDPNDPAALIRAYMVTDCKKRTESWDMAMRYDAEDQRLDETAVRFPTEAVLPDTIGDAQLQFVCAADRAQSDGFPLQIDEVAFAEALIADTQASESPAAIHERMRLDPKVPVIRSKAPGVETFGTPQTTRAGHAVVPPRDYAKGVQIPIASDYDTDVVGQIYDIAYLGVQNGDLVFEKRGYSIDDLAHAGSGQPMRVPQTQKTVHIGDFMIDVLEATPRSLRFRAQLVREGAEGQGG